MPIKNDILQCCLLLLDLLIGSYFEYKNLTFLCQLKTGLSKIAFKICKFLKNCVLVIAIVPCNFI